MPKSPAIAILTVITRKSLHFCWQPHLAFYQISPFKKLSRKLYAKFCNCKNQSCGFFFFSFKPPLKCNQFSPFLLGIKIPPLFICVPPLSISVIERKRNLRWNGTYFRLVMMNLWQVCNRWHTMPFLVTHKVSRPSGACMRRPCFCTLLLASEASKNHVSILIQFSEASMALQEQGPLAQLPEGAERGRRGGEASFVWVWCVCVQTIS